MTLLAALLLAYASVSLLYWLWTGWGVVRIRRGMPRLVELADPAPETWPRLSVIVPARDEAEKLPAAAATLLAADYPDLEIVFVDDRSTDGTGEIIDRLAGGDGRVRALHVGELPPGWLGKVHALERGLAASTGAFVLFTDADVHFRPQTFRKAVAHCHADRLDHLAVLPECWPAGFAVDALVSVFVRQFLVFIVRPWSIGRPGSRAYAGIGAFNLVRRSALEATEGLGWLRREVADDMGLGLLMKRSGARCALVAGFGSVGLRWYRSVPEAARGAEKAYASAWRFRLLRPVIDAAIVLALELSPLLTLLPLAFAPLRAVGYAGLAVLGAFACTAVCLGRWARAPLLPILAGPVIAPLLVALTFRAALVGRRRGGVCWRGTLYATEMLRGGNRVRL